VERLIGEGASSAGDSGHWLGKLDLSAFLPSHREAATEEGGRPAFDPADADQLVCGVYAYSQGIGSARESGEDVCEYDPAFPVADGLERSEPITRSRIFRSGEARERSWTSYSRRFLAAPEARKELITLETVMQDGTKIQSIWARAPES